MTKKKNSSSNSSLSELRFSDLIRFIINLPKKEQEDFLQLMDKVENMPEKEREHALSNLMFGTMLGMDLEQFKNPEKLQQPMMENLIGSDSTEYSYPHFLPRQKVEKYTLRVTLLGFKPSIYRKFNVPSNITLRHLSELIIELMGWENAHLNQFTKGDYRYVPSYQREQEYNPFIDDGRTHTQEEYTLSDLLSEKGKHITFEYDFGDSWTHEVKLSSIGEYDDDDEPLVSFIKGELACPPEDCGGIWGYQDLLELREKKRAKKRLTAEERERLEWYCLDDLKDPLLSPDYYDCEEAQEICEEYCK